MLRSLVQASIFVLLVGVGVGVAGVASAQTPEELGIDPMKIGPYNVWNTDYPDETFSFEEGVEVTFKNGEGAADAFTLTQQSVAYGLVDDLTYPRAAVHIVAVCSDQDECGNGSFEGVVLLTEADLEGSVHRLGGFTFDGHVESLQIDSKKHEVVVDALVYGPDDARAEPTKRVTLRLRLNAEKKTLEPVLK